MSSAIVRRAAVPARLFVGARRVAVLGALAVVAASTLQVTGGFQRDGGSPRNLTVTASGKVGILTDETGAVLVVR